MLEALAQLLADPRIDRPRTNAPITIARKGSVRNSLVLRGNSFDTNGSAAARTCGISTFSSPSSVCTLRGRKPLRGPTHPPQTLAPTQAGALSSTTQPCIELLLDRALNDQPHAPSHSLAARRLRISASLRSPGFSRCRSVS
jgi:hypothetical protein